MAGTTLMRCSRPFAEGKIRVTVNGRDYQFAPNRLGHSICAVHDEDVFTLMNISGAYRKYAKNERPPIDPDTGIDNSLPEPETPPAADDQLEGRDDGDVTEEATPAFLETSPPPTTQRARPRDRKGR